MTGAHRYGMLSPADEALKGSVRRYATTWTAPVLKAWKRQGLAGRVLWALLLPWSAPYRFVVGLRNLLYDLRLLRGRRLPLPVVSVGNLTVGGTGKTPTGLWLAQNLRRRGLEAAILTRGYGGRRMAGRPGTISAEAARAWRSEPGDALLDYGDEAVMLSVLYGQTVGVGADRYQAGVELSRGAGGTQLFVVDDGFQHRGLARDLDLLLLGTDTSGSMLPAGPFREPVRALRRADILLVTGAHDRWRAVLEGRFDDSRVFFAAVEPRGLLGRTEDGLREFPLGDLTGIRVLAVSGVAKPERFYDMVRQCEATIVETLEFPDHHPYTERDWREINRTRTQVDRIVTTEKDYVKLARFPFSTGKLLALKVSLTVDRPEALLDRITEAVHRAASS